MKTLSFAPGYGHASRLAKRPEMAGRIAELRADKAELGDANPQAAGIKEARLTLLEACRLTAETVSERAREGRVFSFQ